MSNSPSRPAGPALSRAGPSVVGRPLKIVAAEKDSATVGFYRAALSPHGHEVRGATNGRQVVELCRAEWPDVLITALDLPDRDGLEVAAELYGNRPLPVVVVSGRIEGGIDPVDHVHAYLPKPIGAVTLSLAVAAAARSFDRMTAALAERDAARRELQAMTERLAAVETTLTAMRDRYKDLFECTPTG